MAKPPEDEPFFSRWSKRKLESAEPPPAPEPEPDAPAAEEPESLSEEELAALPRLEDFTPQTDIRPFLRAGVPQELRNAALRRIWLLTPAIRDHVDPAVDYAWDWNTPGGVPGDGAAPSPERMAQMLREIVAPRRDAAAETGLEVAEKQALDATKTSDVAAPQSSAARPPEPTPSEPVTLSEAEPDAEIPDPKKTQADQSEKVLTRRRHGGALPG